MTDTTNMTGDQFAQALADLGWRQVEFANRTGVGAVTVNRWISGHLPVPTWAQCHVELLLAADQFHRLHVAPPPRPKRRRPTKNQPTTTESKTMTENTLIQAAINVNRALAVIAECLEGVNGFTNYERGCLEEASELLKDGNAVEAIAALADGCEHAFRDNYTEDRPESYACREAWELMTGQKWGQSAA